MESWSYYGPVLVSVGTTGCYCRVLKVACRLTISKPCFDVFPMNKREAKAGKEAHIIMVCPRTRNCLGFPHQPTKQRKELPTNQSNAGAHSELRAARSCSRDKAFLFFFPLINRTDAAFSFIGANVRGLLDDPAFRRIRFGCSTLSINPEHRDTSHAL